MGEMDEVIAEFMVEAREGLDELDADLLAIERDPADAERLARIFRTVHSIKGTCGFLGLGNLEAVAHTGESLLGRLRDGELVVTEAITSALLQLGDALRSSLDVIERDGDDTLDHAELVTALQRLQAGEHVQPLGQMLVASGEAKPADVADAIRHQLEGDDRRVGEMLVDSDAVSRAAVDSAVTEQQARRQPTAADTSVRVDVGVLDELMNLVGELVLARNQIVELTKGRSEAEADPEVAEASQRLNLTTTELQETVMRTRMQPIATVWDRLPRVVRDLSVESGKQVRVEMEGKDTELDKSLLEAIKDPLTHLVRNAVDHGVDSPEERRAAGKPAEGLVRLRAYHEGGQVNIEIADDGRGIDVARVRAKAVERGLITPERAEQSSERDALGLIFQPGFSTAESVTNVSGRGVGMDVVKTDVEAIGGSVDVQSVLGEGSTFKLKIPLTLAIIPGLIVTAADEKFVIPQVSLHELVRLSGDEARSGIEHVHGVPVYRLRGRLLPLVELCTELGLPERGGAESGDVVNLVVLQVDGRTFGLIVDAITDTQEIVVKPLGRHLRDVDAFAGATILGDGRVALILDVLGLGTRAGLLGEATEARSAGDEEVTDERDEQRETLLLVDVDDRRRAAVPLSSVARLEEFTEGDVEATGSREVLQYRGEIMPVVRLSRAFGLAPGADEPDVDTPLSVIVHRREERHVGIAVRRIIDIVDVGRGEIDPSDSPLLAGTTVVGERVTDVVDVPHLLADQPPEPVLR